jgi:4-carboxymuconolactone decarboxylase
VNRLASLRGAKRRSNPISVVAKLDSFAELVIGRRFTPTRWLAMTGEISMDDQQRRDDGMAQRRKVLGDAWVDKSVANRNSFNADFIDLITRHAWGEIWTRPHFDQRTRRVLVIGTMVALGQWDEFRLHVRAALAEGGFTPDDIKEILLQQAIYCGVPAANHAVKEASAIVGELGLLKG